MHSWEWRVTFANGSFLPGRALGLTLSDTLLIGTEADLTRVPIRDVVRLSRDDGSHFWAGAGIGALAGLATSIIAWRVNNYASRCSNCGDGEGIALAIGIPTTTLLGALLGGGVGAFVPDRDEADLSTMTSEEQKLAIERLLSGSRH